MNVLSVKVYHITTFKLAWIEETNFSNENVLFYRTRKDNHQGSLLLVSFIDQLAHCVEFSSVPHLTVCSVADRKEVIIVNCFS